MKKYLLGLVLVITCVFSAETILGNINLNDSYSKVLEKYPAYGKFESLEMTHLPYPSYLMDKKTPVYLAETEKLDILFYCSKEQKVQAIVTYFSDKEKSIDKTVYETSAGLRPGDGQLEMKLLYGDPLDSSEYKYIDENKLETTRRIYYYPNLCLHTRQQANLPEFIESLVLTEYDMNYVLNHKDEAKTQDSL